MNCYIITGANRGLGLALAKQITAQGAYVHALARSETPELAAVRDAAKGYQFHAIDLADTEGVTDLANTLFGEIAKGRWDGIYLINNAGTVEPVGLAGQYNDAGLSRCLTINLTAALQISNAFIRYLQSYAADKRILNISSGAGRNAYPGWSAYCTSKAGLDMYSRCVGVEQASLSHGIRIASIAPGIIDTGMQAAIRSHSTEEFPIVAQFHDYHAQGALAKPDATAAKLVGVLHSDSVAFGDILNIRDFA
ncbi:MAG: SDR family NAD(P)-dependent oxidoreductase [Burkholderiales bacterium]|nr:SDR family NAD(P)-dependent oxidoreductase [Burkholderiales bacterium]